MRKLLTAAQIASLKLPGLPSTKVGVHGLAEREGWYFEESKGVGGTRRLYEVPAKYLPYEKGTSGTEHKIAEPSSPPYGKVGTIAAGSSTVDPAKLELAIRAVDEWELERGIKIDKERRPAVIAILYDHLQRGGEEQMSVVLRALGGM